MRILLNGIRAAIKKPKKEDMAALLPEEFAELMMEVANATINRTSCCLIELQLHTTTLPAETITIRLADIDFHKRISTISPERVKNLQTNTVSFTDPAIFYWRGLSNSAVTESMCSHQIVLRTHANSQTIEIALKRTAFRTSLLVTARS